MFNKKVIRTKEDKIRIKEEEKLRQLQIDIKKICPSCKSEDTTLIDGHETIIEGTLCVRIQTEIYECNGCGCDYSVDYEGNDE